jgi:multidrug resistance efflux pump
MGDVRTTTGEKLPPTATERRSRKWRVTLSILLVLTAIGVVGHAVHVPRYAPATGYATTSGYAEVRAATTGKIAAILSTSGAIVKEGDILVQLEDDAERAALAEAKSTVAKGEAELTYREAAVADGARQHANRIRAAEMDLSHARERLDVTKQLHAKGLASGRQLSDDEHGVAKGEDTVRALREIDLSVEARQLDVLRRDVETRREALTRAEAAVAQRAVRAPRGGRIVRYTFYVGELVRPDMVLYEVFDGEVDTLKLRIPERYAARVQPGMRVEAQLGTYRTLLPTRFKGKVDILRDVVEGDGTRNYRVAYCTLDREGHAVAPGTSADARIHVGRSSLWNVLLQP